ncbi:PD-(D/E)XK nuclease family protein [Marinococcus halophilus]|uniref:PD-(D/E)XK endonuclease-like domain-containing protein n=1 Tax=Marinococcus halophilus TaxID=1371 RepID=A0A510Y1T0_MARHA|nr:hypothetical protein [Marinococcus halophilus]GEK57143.1 hypothetical protein MHA01_00480 [Marinococcus halophilus]
MDKSKLFVSDGEELRNEVTKKDRADELTKAMANHFERFHSLDEIFDKDIETQVLEEELDDLKNPKKPNFQRLPTFSPSSASKCERELYYKLRKEEKDEQPMLPYQRRWVRNGTAIHAAVQKDLLYAEQHLKNPKFTVHRMENGTPAWESNIKDVKPFEYKGVDFQVFGMMDGILEYTPDGSKVGFEFKTKSTTIGAIGDFKMKDIQQSHKEQAVAYSLLFDVDEFVFVYESLAKDSWLKQEDAKNDMRFFYYKPTQKEKNDFLAKCAFVAKSKHKEVIPDGRFPDKCLFCPFKSVCESDGGTDAYDSDAVEAEKLRKEEEKKRKAEERRKKAKK